MIKIAIFVECTKRLTGKWRKCHVAAQSAFFIRNYHPALLQTSSKSTLPRRDERFISILKSTHTRAPEEEERRRRIFCNKHPSAFLLSEYIYLQALSWMYTWRRAAGLIKIWRQPMRLQSGDSVLMMLRTQVTTHKATSLNNNEASVTPNTALLSLSRERVERARHKQHIFRYQKYQNKGGVIWRLLDSTGEGCVCENCNQHLENWFFPPQRAA
jgi:hypothetical protein